MASVLQTLGTPRRREILRLVWDGEKSAGAIHRALGDVTFGAVSQHLRLLQEASLAHGRRQGRHRFYVARKDELGPARLLARVPVGRRPVPAEAAGRARGEPPRSEATTPAPAGTKETAMTALDHVLERTVLIRARRETVFRYFTDNERFAAWWGTGSTIEARPGGTLSIRYPNGVLASGEVIEVVPPRAHRLHLRVRGSGQTGPARRLARRRQPGGEEETGPSST